MAAAVINTLLFCSHITDGSTSRSVASGLQSFQTVYLCVCLCMRTAWYTSWLVTLREMANVWQLHKSFFPAFRREASSPSVRNLFMRFQGEVDEQPVRVLESLTLFTLGLGSLHPTDPHYVPDYVCVCVMELSHPSPFTRTHTYAFSNHFLQLWKVKIITWENSKWTIIHWGSKMWEHIENLLFIYLFKPGHKPKVSIFWKNLKPK